MNLTDAFIADIFRRRVKYDFEYKVTSAIANDFFSQGVDAFLYPSVGHLGGWNIAISKEASETKFVPVRSEVYEIYDAPGYGLFGKTIRKQSNSISKDGVIEFLENPLARSFRTFDEFIYHWCRQRGRHILVGYAVAQRDIEQFGPNKAFQIADEEAAMYQQPAGLSLGENFSVPITADLGWEQLKKLINDVEPDWTGVLVDIVGVEKSEQAFERLEARINKGDVKGMHLFSKYGEADAIAKLVKLPD